ncbi:MAG TPA: glycosyltransferase family 4 protein [Gemmatimonadales bacterium]|nr:glycosyltransferase family 4 protein [Gemmatimonadales bacterium]
MRILFLAPQPFFQQRGTPIAAKLLLQVLSRAGHEIDVVTYHEGADVALPGVRIKRIPALPFVRNIRPGFSWKKIVCDAVMLGVVLREAAHRRYDLVHAIEESVFMAAIVKALFGFPFVYDMDSSLTEQLLERARRLRPLRPLLARCERLAVRHSTGVLAVCRALVDTARAYDPTKLIACVEDPSFLESDAPAVERLRARTGGTAELTGPLVLYVGNLASYQGIDLLLEAFALVVEQAPTATLVLIGGPGERIRHYRALAATRGLGRRVRFLGPRPLEQLGGYLRQADVLVSPRITGVNTPMKIYSYLDSGVPVVATRLPTHTQVLDDDTALLVEPTAEALAGGLVRLLEDPELRAALAARAKERAAREFTRAATIGKLRRFYRRLEGELERPPVLQLS